jgi:hypothetical protein
MNPTRAQLVNILVDLRARLRGEWELWAWYGSALPEPRRTQTQLRIRDLERVIDGTILQIERTP